MTIKKFDDATGAEIPLDQGIEVIASFVGKRPKVFHYATWDAVPKRVLDGTIGGDTVAMLTMRDVAITPVPRQEPRRGVPVVPAPVPEVP